MKLRSAYIVFVVISFISFSTFFSACKNNGESAEKISAEKEKRAKAVEQLQKVGDKPDTDKAVALIDETSNSLPQIIASINDVKIPNMSIKSTLNRLKLQVTHQKQPITKEQIKNILNQTMEMEIQREVLFQKSEDLKIKVEDKEVTTVIDQLKSRYESEEDFLNDFSKRGLSLEKLTGEIRRNIMISKVIQKEIHDKIKISDKQAKDFYSKNENSFKEQESVHAAHILIKADNKASEEDKKAAKNKIEEILSKARAGEDFAELAKKYSEGPSASRGGDLNYFARGQMVKEFEDVAFGLNAGDISDAVKTQFGYHIIKVIDKKSGGGLKPFEDVKGSISNFLKQSEVQKMTKSYMEELTKKADIKRFI